jgi:hypothetical protein
MSMLMRLTNIGSCGEEQIKCGFGREVGFTYWTNRSLARHLGEFLKNFVFEANDGQGELVTTPQPEDAKRFSSAGEGILYMQTIPKCRPVREDGRCNRPMTNYYWHWVPSLDLPIRQAERNDWG